MFTQYNEGTAFLMNFFKFHAIVLVNAPDIYTPLESTWLEHNVADA